MPIETLQGVGLAVLIVLSGFFSGIETAFTSLTSPQVHALQEKHRRLGQHVAHLMTMPDRLLSTILIGNNLVNIAAASLATVIATRLFGELGPAIATGGLTLIVLVFGEVTPKQIAIAHNDFIAAHTSRVIIALEIAFRPLVVLVAGASRLITRITGGTPSRSPTAEGILSVVKHAASVGVLTSQESWFMKNVLRFHDVTVGMIMTHRTKVFSFDRRKTVTEALDSAIEAGYSRIPVFDADPERIVGIVLLRDMMKAVNEGRRDARVSDVMKQAPFVPETRKVQQMLQEFRREHQHIAIVLDEYGGLAGIVTLEDVIEEILGEIYDENETREREGIIARSDGTWDIAGETPIHLVNERLGTSFEGTRNTQTVGGFLADLAGHIPAQGDILDTSEGRFTIERISRKRVLEARFEKTGEGEKG